MTDPAPDVYGCTIDGQPAMPILLSEYNALVARAVQAEAERDQARRTAANAYGQRDRLRTRIVALAERWQLPGHISMPQAAAEVEEALDRETWAPWPDPIRQVLDACDQLRRAAVLADGRPHTDREHGIVHAVNRILAALDRPAPAICELPHETIAEEDACEEQRLATLEQPVRTTVNNPAASKEASP